VIRQTAQTSTKAKIPTKSDLGFESGYGSGCQPNCCENVVDSLPSRRPSFCRVSLQSAGDCTKNANKQYK